MSKAQEKEGRVLSSRAYLRYYVYQYTYVKARFRTASHLRIFSWFYSSGSTVQYSTRE